MADDNRSAIWASRRRLSPQDVEDIRMSHESVAALAEKYGVNKTTIYDRLRNDYRAHRGKRAKPLVIRLHSKILRDENSGCWLWQGPVCRAGYGKIGEGYRGGRILKTHRVAWELHRGPIPEGMNVLHRCDTPNCVNPAHLWLGSHMDNVRDKIRKGRARSGTVRGEKNVNSKITREQAMAIRSDPRSQGQIAADYGISRSNVSSIKRGVTWNW